MFVISVFVISAGGERLIKFVFHTSQRKLNGFPKRSCNDIIDKLIEFTQEMCRRKSCIERWQCRTDSPLSGLPNIPPPSSMAMAAGSKNLEINRQQVVLEETLFEAVLRFRAGPRSNSVIQLIFSIGKDDRRRASKVAARWVRSSSE